MDIQNGLEAKERKARCAMLMHGRRLWYGTTNWGRQQCEGRYAGDQSERAWVAQKKWWRPALAEGQILEYSSATARCREAGGPQKSQKGDYRNMRRILRKRKDWKRCEKGFEIESSSTSHPALNMFLAEPKGFVKESNSYFAPLNLEKGSPNINGKE